MSKRSPIRLLLFTAFGWLLILWPALLTQRIVVQNASVHRRAEFEVKGSNCIGGQPSYDSTGRPTGTLSRYCFLEGLVFTRDGEPGVREEISIGSSVPRDRPPGNRMWVFYNPDLPAYGTNYLNQRTIPADEFEGPDPDAAIERWLARAQRLVFLSLGLMVLTFVMLHWGVKRMRKSSHRTWRADLGGGLPIIGTFFFSQGLTFLVMQNPSSSVAIAILGLTGLGLGAIFLTRRFISYSIDERSESHGRHLFGMVLPKRTQRKATYEKGRVAVSGDQLELRLVGSGDDLVIPFEKAEKAVLDLADRIQRQLHIPIATSSKALDNWHGLRERRAERARSRVLRALIRCFLVLALVTALAGSGWWALDHLAKVRLGLMQTALAPDSGIRQWTPLRRFILSRVPPDAGEQEQLELLRLLNAIDHERFPEIAGDLAWALVRSTGGERPLEADSPPSAAEIYRRLAEQLGREVDPNGGVFPWLTIDERFLNDIEAIAAADLRVAWGVWISFGAGLLDTPEKFLYAVGPALADRRPIHFAIRRGSFHGVGSDFAFEGQPEPIEEYPDVIARTVGEALALQYWKYRGIGSDTFPEDFSDWWQRWAHDHHLPPGPARISDPGSGDLPAEAPQELEKLPSSGTVNLSQASKVGARHAPISAGASHFLPDLE